MVLKVASVAKVLPPALEEERLLPHDRLPSHMVLMAVAVGDDPVAGFQLAGFEAAGRGVYVAAVGDAVRCDQVQAKRTRRKAERSK